MQDMDRYRNEKRLREKQLQIDATRAKFSKFSGKFLDSGRRTISPTRSGLLPMLLFWCVVMGIAYSCMTIYLKPNQARVLSNGDLVISRAQDGHFYTMGMVNGREAKFLVDTGASLVSVTESFAQKALILGGLKTTFKTANGERQGRVVSGVGVSVGPVHITNLKVGVGLSGFDEDEALLGQSFLSKFDITIDKDQMVLRPR
jgi:aspartyl protease family protein